MTRQKLQASINTPINPIDNLIRETTKNTIGVLYKQQQHTLRPSSLHLHRNSNFTVTQTTVACSIHILPTILHTSLTFVFIYYTKNTLLQAKIRCYKADHPTNTAMDGSRFSQLMHRRVFQYFHLAVSDLTVRLLTCMQTSAHIKHVWRNNEMWWLLVKKWA